MSSIENGLKALLLLAVGLLLAVFISAWFSSYIALSLGMESGAQFHMTLATVAILMALFADTCVLFYFIGTAVWMRDRSKELLISSRKNAETAWALYEKANKLKAKTFPFATLGIGLGLFTFVLGGANQVGAIPKWLHPALAALLLINEMGALRFYFSAMKSNVVMLDEVSNLLDQAQSLKPLPRG